ncbi:hypothetical protein TVAG_467730 [Trichomonas vaginalis G3]|uniref:Origin recognition complex subunit 1 n=1 Tax=Trichomonas vaginalis (strain ATCC PRA-98 / G3) TaxID=412133 RepID=A2E0L3_TRIV3|nr:cell division control protein 6-related family [Trichomonas vaginalis G3]EAY13758.1 hypothetical protein TVAG_467730 [Trichomonas vaginalis G3]KAI5542726.1 cell division control protein 6-related family [Trichomonas vaginalis G3]|eukprot:XP_001325981.1 hypothetical protein [Trichomonas vaginalis G3]
MASSINNFEDNSNLDSSIETLLENLNQEYFTTALPCRSNEIEAISTFINNSYDTSRPIHDIHMKGRKPKQNDDIQPGILYITGNPGTGKTACVKYAIQTSAAAPYIKFSNCKTEKITLYKAGQEIPIIQVLDEVESYTDFAEIAANSIRMKYSLICISNASEDNSIIQKSSGLSLQQLKFNSYTAEELCQILTERIGGPCNNLVEVAIEHLAKTVLKDRGDARAAIARLATVLTAAIQENIKTISLKEMISLLSHPQGTIKFDLPLYQQIALAAIYLAGKNWVKKFNSIVAEKNLESFSDTKSVFDQLCDYPGLVKGNFKNPVAIVSKETIIANVDHLIKTVL